MNERHTGRSNPDVNSLARTLALLPLALVWACSSDTAGLADGGIGGMDVGTSTTTATCADDDDCPADQHCDDASKRCVDGSGNACTTNAECGANERCLVVTDCGASRCHGNACVPAECTTPDGCSGDLVCVEGACVEPPACRPTGTCPDGLECDVDSGRCLPVPGCTRDLDCPDESTICIFGRCEPEVSCTESSSCPEGLVCQAGSCREPCTMDEDCGSRFMWRCDTGTGVCQPRCANDRGCPAGQICEGFVCSPAECAADTDCDTSMSEECTGLADGHGRCRVVPRCMDTSDCEPNFECREQRCRELDRCTGDRECGAMEYCESGHCQPAMGCTNASCPAGTSCIADRCVPGGCRGLEDCPNAGELCIAGTCQLPPPPNTIVEVRIVTPAGVVRPGSSYRFTAIALNQAGAVVPGVAFDWVSTSSVVAAIDATGLATGGSRAGETQIIARTSNGATRISSPPVSLINLGALAAGDVRVTVVDAPSGVPVLGAVVGLRVGGFTATSTVDASGRAVFTGVPAGARTVTAFGAAHDMLALVGVAGDDLILPLPSLTGADRAAGIRGNVDLSQVTSTGGLAFSISGASFESPLIGFRPTQLFGSELHQVPVMIPMAGSFDVPVGASSTLAVEVFGQSFDLKDTYYTETRQGLRAAWCFGGRIDLGILTGGGGGGGPGDILGATLPYFQRFQHAVRPAVSVIALPKVADANDLDGDGDTAELRPDFASFPDVGLAPSVAQSLRYQLRTENARLPFVTGGNANTLLVVTGTLLPGVGFVPLGLDGLSDNGGNGLVRSFTTKLAPPHSGLELGDFAVMATAFRATMGGLPGPGSTRLFVAPSLPTEVDFRDGWLDSPLNGVFVRASSTVELPTTTGADLVRVRVLGAQSAVHLYASAGAGPIAIPPELAARVGAVATATLTADAIDLVAGADLGSVFDVAGGGSAALDRSTRGFSEARLRHQ